MIYHIVVTLGNEYINTKKSELPKYPMLKFFFENRSESSFRNGEITLNEPKYTFDQYQNIPDYDEPVKNIEDELLIKETGLSRAIKLLPEAQLYGYHPYQQKPKVNKRLYKERLDILQEWLGYEKLSLSIANDSEIFASGIRVKICIPKNERIMIKIIGDKIPKIPETHIYIRPMGMHHNNYFNDPLHIKSQPFITEYDDLYEINWERAKLQANTVTKNGLDLLVKVNDPIDINYTIFCDQLPRPFNSKVTLHPSENIRAIDLADIIEDDNFERLYISIHETFKEDSDD